jgi:hypothetical protein
LFRTDAQRRRCAHRCRTRAGPSTMFEWRSQISRFSNPLISPESILEISSSDLNAR